MLLHHLQRGSGIPIVLLHGFCENLHIWDTFMAPLAAQAHVIALDLPGFGQNDALDREITIDEMAEQVHQTLHELGIVSGSVVGHSLGGYVSLALAEKYPQWIQGLCLFHSTAFADSPEKKEKRDKAIQFIQQHGITAFNDGLIPSLFAASQREALRDTIEEVKSLANLTSPQTAMAVTRAMKNRPDRTAVLQQAHYPVMFIAGREDDAVPLKDIQAQCWLPSGTVSIHALPKVGHMGMYEQPQSTLAMLEALVRLVSK